MPRFSYRMFITRQPFLEVRHHRATGFTYVGLLILVAILAFVSTATLQLGVVTHRRAAEEALLDIGNNFRIALISYANATPAGQNRHPISLEALLLDARYPQMRRHLRTLPVDPITGKNEWGLVRMDNQKEIYGVYSLSTAKPIKVGNFPPHLPDFENKNSYADWKFTINEQLVLPRSNNPLNRR